MSVHVEYLGFTTANGTREYRLRARSGDESHDFVRAIPLSAFVARRARFQDAPEICFLKLQRELAAAEGSLPDSYVRITDSELEEYRVAHSTKPSQRSGPKPTPHS